MSAQPKTKPKLTPELLAFKRQLENGAPKDQFDAAIDYALGQRSTLDTRGFLSLWRDSDWQGLFNEFPDFKPAPARLVAAEADNDSLLSAEELLALFGEDGEYEAYPHNEWLQAAQDGETRQGYWDWVYGQLCDEMGVDLAQGSARAMRVVSDNEAGALSL
jgi:hypothetical protein